VVATSTKIVLGNTLADALNLLIAGGPGPTPTPGPTPSPSPGTSGSPGPTGAPTALPTASGPPPSGAIPPPPVGDVAALVAYANFHFEQAQEALRAGDFARYGQEIAAVQAALALLSQVVGTPVPSVAGSASFAAPSGSVAPVASPSP